MSTPMNSAQFKAIVEPILNKPFKGIYDQRADEWKQVFRYLVSPVKRRYYEVPVIVGFRQAPELPEGKPFDYDTGQTFYVARTDFKVYGLAFALTKETIEDGDHISLGSTFSKHLAQSLIETKEWNTANVLNRAFNTSYKGGDNQPLISTSHPLINGGSASNQLATAAALSQTSVEQMLIQISNAVSPEGRKIRLKPKKLVVPNTLRMQAKVITQTPLRTGTANNDINPIQGELSEVATFSRMTSNTNWFIQTETEEGLQLVQRSPLDKGMEGDFETRSMRYKADERYGTFWVDWRDLWGTPGA
ncbi:MAG: Mu-like prophage major head subunit gpT family protein [Alphaproteobacteria bacterium]